MTYANVVEWRRAEVDALRPWMRVIEQTLSSDRVIPAGIRVAFDVADYLREDPKTRMETWNLALEKGVLELPEVRANEPLARSL